MTTTKTKTKTKTNSPTYLPCPHLPAINYNVPGFTYTPVPMAYTKPTVKWFRQFSHVPDSYSLDCSNEELPKYVPALTKTLICEQEPHVGHHYILVKYEGFIHPVRDKHSMSWHNMPAQGKASLCISKLSVYRAKTWASSYALFYPKNKRIQVFAWISLAMNIEDHRLYRMFPGENIIDWFWERTHCDIEFREPAGLKILIPTGEKVETECRTRLILRAKSILRPITRSVCGKRK